MRGLISSTSSDSGVFKGLRSRGLLLAMVLAVAPLTACRGPAQVGEPLTEKLAGSDPESQMEFWHELYQRKLTSNDEAFHAILLFLDGKDEAAAYGDRVSSLKARGLLHDSFNGAANDAVSRGDLAVVIVNALKIRGGLILTVFPRSPRYATRELQYIGIYPTSSTNQTFSGGQFVSIIGRLEDYQRSRPAKAAEAPVAPQEDAPAAPAAPAAPVADKDEAVKQ
ncbi:MAG: hypothetical protein WD768_21920 [Phycisphaeraceae bacterium]